MVTKIKHVLGLCVLGVLTLGSGAGFAVTACPDPGQYPYNGCSLDGLVKGSFPYFTQSAYVTLKNKKNGDFYLTASYGGVASEVSEFRASNSVDDIYNIDNTFFQFKAKSKKGDVTGSIRIMGMLDGMSKQETLMTADLDGVWASSGQLIGFNTMNIQCGDAITALVTCTTNEVIYLTQLNDALDPGGAKGKYQTTGLAVTSVPVPAAVWLFGSGLVGLAGVVRRRKV
ncbi:MAG: VPLPA-CTERM sorting domain-containing protein [Gammaproteobacteria bacterium]|jgi:hypothetical protein